MTTDPTDTSDATAAAEPLLPARGINHLALVCSDMAETVAFYQGLLGFPLVKTVELPAGMGQHFFFDIGGGDQLAFFWFPGAPAPVPGISAPAARPDIGDLVSAVGSMNHVAFDVPADQIDAIRTRLIEAGIECSELVYHDDSEWTVSKTLHEGCFVASVYFFGPDGVLLELASWTRDLRPDDVRHAPATAADAAAYLSAAAGG
ncbi:MAG: VOC family protein [Acidimicrobiales bacterium]